MNKITLLFFTLFFFIDTYSTDNRKWDAQWISHPQSDLLNYGVFHFRNTIIRPFFNLKNIVHHCNVN